MQLRILLSFAVLSLAARTAPAADVGRSNFSDFDPRQPYTANFLYLDTSLSLLPDQFEKGKSVTDSIASRDIEPNALFWLCTAEPKSPKLFPVPPEAAWRSQRTTANARIEERRSQLHEVIERQQQQSRTTDLRGVVEHALNVLQAHQGRQGAKRRRLILITDFIHDTGAGQLSTVPPPTTGLSAAGLQAILLVATPKPEYLAQLRISRTELYQLVSDQWTAFFRTIGAKQISVRVLDAVALGTH